ncbi:tyrosine-type recombinase/integrase [Limnoglobus roseus]|uniref:Site-specific integrase n=1 Tax=Limnoglobus roseus TaxID=2598579 RepID=A0A5C1AEQ4_9BACT|nr:site-specific integrase [Limnoglobus roseus]QEL17781.1 site-specific integrase [Limnoglobus roseus]
MRQPKPWYRAALDAWYVEHHGKQVRLGDHPADFPPPKKSKSGWLPPPPILDAFYKLMATDPANLPKTDKLVVRMLCELFLEHSHTHHAGVTYDNYKHFLQSFTDAYGTLLAADIKPFHVSRWLDDNPSWKGGRRHAIIAVKSAYSWADLQGVLSPNPLRKVKAGRANRRTRILTPEEVAEIVGAIRDTAFKRFVQALLETGCRPSEVARVRAEHVDLAAGVWRLPEHKTAKKTHKPRVVYLTPAMVELSRTLAAEQPNGPLFRGPRKKTPFTRQAIRCRFLRLRAKLPHLKHFVCYNVRHTYATNALVNGVGVAQVAELLGHTSTEMVSSTYGHLAEQVQHMRDAARKAISGGA